MEVKLMDQEQQHATQELQRANLDLIHTYEATFDGWTRALELRDAHTGHHTLRVTELSLRLARIAGIEKDKLIHLRRGAALHDVGKMGIPDSILNKPGPLTEAEWRQMRQHPEMGYQILSPITFLNSAAEIAYCHHENWDGSGYPRGLKGESIPFMARIVSVCNVFDALVSNQPYRQAWHWKAACNYIQNGSGKQFDPEIVAAFLQVF